MKPRLLILEHEVKEPSRTCRALLMGRCARVAAADRFTGLVDLEQAVVERAQAPGQVIVLNWGESMQRHLMVEAIMQGRVLSGLPLLVFYEEIDPDDFSYLKEYSLDRITLAMSLNLQIDCERLGVAAMAAVKSGTLAAEARRFFHLLHVGAADAAETQLTRSLAGNVDVTERHYLRGHLYKAQRDYPKAMAHLAQGLKLLGQVRRFDPRFLHLIGNVAFHSGDDARAAQFLEAAHRASPRNPRRILTLAKVARRSNAAATALGRYRQALAICPRYPTAHHGALEVMIESAQRPSDLHGYTDLLSQVPDRSLLALTAKVTARAASPVARDIADPLSGAIFRLADLALAEGDHFRVCNYYAYAKQLLKMNSRGAKVEYLYRRAEELVRIGSLSAAEKATTVLANGGAEGERWQRLQADLRAARGMATPADS